jgi:RNA polymerase sigma-70 factor (ECF subfamily)
MSEDKILMASFQAGDQESFEKLIRKYRIPGLSFAKKHLADIQTAEDIVQESFADLYVYRDRYDSKFSFKTYLFCIIKNKCYSYLRKNKELLYIQTDLISDQTPDLIILRNEKLNIVRKMLNQLKDDYRTVIYLSEFEDFSYEEIAKIMNKNIGQIKVMIHRAKKKLRTLLEKEV